MARRPDHPSGAAINITLRLSPHHLKKFDALAARAGVSRSKFVMGVVDFLVGDGDG